MTLKIIKIKYFNDLSMTITITITIDYHRQRVLKLCIANITISCVVKLFSL